MNDSSPEVVRSEISGHDIDEARLMFEGAYNGHRFAVEPGEDFAYRYTSVGDSDMTLRGSYFGGSVQGRIQTEGEYVVSWLTAGTGVTDIDGDPVALQLGQRLGRLADRISGRLDLGLDQAAGVGDRDRADPGHVGAARSGDLRQRPALHRDVEDGDGGERSGQHAAERADDEGGTAAIGARDRAGRRHDPRLRLRKGLRAPG